VSGVPYAEALGGRDAAKVIAETPVRLGLILDGLSAAEIEMRPALGNSGKGKWSVREIVAHLADCEIAWAWRLRQALGEEHAVIQPFEQDAWAKMYDAYSLEAAWATFKALRAWNVALVGALSEADRRKMYTHPERGEETVWTMVEIMGGHDLHHLAGLKKSLDRKS
jgi:uncharacterized damage-inducible protein DinB